MSQEDQPKTTDPKADQPQAEEPKAQGPKADQPKGEKPKAQEPKAGQPKGEKPKAQEPKGEKQKGQQPKGGEGKPGKGKQGKQKAAEEKPAERRPPPPSGPARLAKRYREEVVPQLTSRLGVKNPLGAPRLTKVVLNMGVGKAKQDQKFMKEAQFVLRSVSGQQPVVTRARKSVSGFGLRVGVPIGCMVTLRGRMMYEFMDRLISIVLPRIRDFRGLSSDSFDGHGNYSLGIKEHIVFPEVDPDGTESIYGMDVTICTTAKTDPAALELLTLLGMPFRQ